MAQDRKNEIEKYAKSQAQEWYESLLKDDVNIHYARLYANIALNNLKKGAEWADQTMLDKACEWLKNNKDNPFIKCEDPCLSGYLTDEFIDEFRKAMKE